VAYPQYLRLARSGRALEIQSAATSDAVDFGRVGGLAIGPRRGRAGFGSPRRPGRSLRASAEIVIDSLLDDPALGPQTLASELGVSRATLYRAFAPVGGIQGFIRGRRLERAWAFAAREISINRYQAAKLCGFARAADLDRVLGAEFGAGFDQIRGAFGEARERLTRRAQALTDEGWLSRI
jgi:AraC-like DNA-binding protein